MLSKTLFLMSLLILLTTRVEAGDLPQSKSAPAQKSKFNTQIYEQESDSSSFTDTVKSLRAVADQSQVFFNTRKGVFHLDTSLDGGTAHNLLAMSQKKQIPVNITINTDSRQILKVSIGEASPAENK